MVATFQCFAPSDALLLTSHEEHVPSFHVGLELETGKLLTAGMEGSRDWTGLTSELAFVVQQRRSTPIQRASPSCRHFELTVTTLLQALTSFATNASTTSNRTRSCLVSIMAKSKFQTRLGSGSGVRASAVPKTANKKATGSSQQASKLTQTTLAFHAPSQSASTQPVASSSTAVAKAKLLDRKSEKVSWENSEQTQSQPPAKRQRISLRPQPPPSCSSSTKDKGKQRARPVAQESLPAESFVELSQFQCAFNTSNVDGFPQHIAHIGYVEKTISPVKQKQRPRSSQAEPVARKPTVVLELEDVETEEDEDEQEAGQVVSLPKAVNADDSGIGFGAEGTEVELPPELPSQEPATSQFSSGPVVRYALST